MCKVFVTAHQSVEATSKRMLAQLSRRNYVTPTNYLETVRGGGGRGWWLGMKRLMVGNGVGMGSGLWVNGAIKKGLSW